ncbi:MAG: response regulator [Porphyromonadaceae bacterium]|nr:response regulator [Porphyromonadaceae bacterium]
MRNAIFAKISHEFRTPLTIILGLSKQLREQKDISANNSQTYLNAIERQGRNLSDLVNQLFDITNLNTGEDTVEWKRGNIVAFMEMIFENYSIYASQQGMELQFFCEEDEIETDFVPNFLQKILRNLITNAIKYSEPGSRINLLLSSSNKKGNKKIIFKVIDQGKGITAEELPHIYELFYRGNNCGTQTGNGIGLTLTKQLVDLLNGTIEVRSEEGKGTEFTVTLPVLQNEKRLYSHWIPEKNHTPVVKQQPLLDREELFSYQNHDNDSRTTILLAEDNKDIAIYTKAIFNTERYNIIYCHNGEEALEMANEHLPDIVITDVIMPKMNGLELCQQIKNSPLLSHIPIVVISAKNEEKDYIEGLKCGADAYIRKPFTPEELQMLTENLLKSRDRLKEKYQRAIVKEEKSEQHDNLNMNFLRHVTDIIYREMKNPDFSSNKLAKELAISVSQLNKKLNATTGYPASTYILQVKLSHAKKILASQNKTIGEVASECGVYDINYFSRVFKKHTGVTPSQYRRLPVHA